MGGGGGGGGGGGTTSGELWWVLDRAWKDQRWSWLTGLWTASFVTGVIEASERYKQSSAIFYFIILSKTEIESERRFVYTHPHRTS